MYPFLILQDYVSKKMVKYMEDNSLSYCLSLQLQDLKAGTMVVSGGKVIKLINDILNPGNYIVTLDDGLGEMKVYLLGPIYNEFKEMISPDNILLVKGYISTRHISGVSFFVGTSLSLIVCNKEEAKK